MKNLILCLALLVATIVPTTLCADTLKAHGGPMQVENLPADANNWYVSVMGNPSDPEYQKLVQWFQTNPQLQTLADRTHYSVIPSTSQLYRKRYAPTAATLPCVRVQTADGTVLCQLSGDNIPATSPAMYSAIKTYCLRRCDPSPQPNIHYHIHKTEPEAKPEPKPETPFEDEPLPTPAEDKPLWPWLIVVGVVSIVVGVAHEWRKSLKL